MIARAFDDPDLSATEVFACIHCGSITDGERCEECGRGGAVVHDIAARGRKAVAARWSEDVAACGFTATPNVLQDHYAALGLSELDYVLLDLIEQHRRDGPTAWPSHETLAAKTAKSRSTVERRLSAMRKLGLIEWTTERGAGARFERNVYTRRGLTAVCQLIAANRRGGLEGEAELEGVYGLLEKLAKRAADHPAPVRGGGGRGDRIEQATPHPCGSPPRTHAAHHPAPVPHEAETREAEAEETDSAYAATSQSDDGRVEEDEVAAIIEFLDEFEAAAIEGTAVELPAQAAAEEGDAW